MIERWNSIDSAKMAVSVESVLYRILNNRNLPFDFDEALDSGIAFLEEAKSGGAIICGSPETNDFTGTLSPLRLSTSVCLSFESTVEEKEGIELYKDIVDTLKKYKNLLEKIKEKKEIEAKKERTTANQAYEFFNALSKVLIKQTDPISETYSRQV